jgi:putative ABC transport system permease protein
MVISVLERRSEIGAPRAIGATRRHIRLQFLTEAPILASIGGVCGALLGSAVTAGYARTREVPFSMPPVAIAGGVGAAPVVGLLAGLLPAGRAARLAPGRSPPPLKPRICLLHWKRHAQ